MSTVDRHRPETATAKVAVRNLPLRESGLAGGREGLLGPLPPRQPLGERIGAALGGEGVLIAVLATIVSALAVIPLFRLGLAAIAPAGSLDLARFADVLTRPATVAATWRTLDTAFFGMLGALALGGPFAFLLSMTDVPGRRAFSLALLVPMVIAPQVTALAWMTATGPASPLLNALGLAPAPGSAHPLTGRGGIILLYAVQHAPLVFIALRAGFSRIPGDLVEAARATGASPLAAVITVILPLMRPALIAAAALAFVAGIGNFGIPALLGLPTGYTTLPTLIYQRLASNGTRVLADAAVLSMVVAALGGLGIAVQALALGQRAQVAGQGTVTFALGRARGLVAALIAAVLALILLMPFLALLSASLIPTYGVPLSPATVTLGNFAEVLLKQDATIRAFRNSFLLAGGAAILLPLLAILMARALEAMPQRAARLVEGVTEIPYALPGIVVAIAAILLFLRPLPIVKLSLYATPWIILFAYCARFLPLALKPVAAAMAQMPREDEEAAAVLGAGLWRRLATILAPAVAAPAIAGGLMVFLSAFNELTVSALLWSAGTETLGVVLFNLEEGGYGPLAAAIAVTTILVSGMLLLALDRLGRRLPPGILPWR